MQLIHVGSESYVISKWSGGTTIQLGIGPEGATYSDRNFLWRLSSATVDNEESSFTSLPDYNRLISLFDGEITIVHNNEPEIILKPYEIHAFDGGWDTVSRGKCRDFNLMLKKGRTQGNLQSVRYKTAGTAMVTRTVGAGRKPEHVVFAIHVAEGEISIKNGEENMTAKSSETIFALDYRGEALEIVHSQDTSLFLAGIELL